jgi:hypothetical protein
VTTSQRSFKEKLEILETFFNMGKVKHKAIPLRVWTGPDGFRRLRLPDFKTTGT